MTNLSQRDAILFRVLVEQDAIFTPNRLWKPSDIAVVLQEKQLAYRAAGVRWRTEAESRPERRDATRALRSLAVDRLADIVVITRIASVRLTAKGDAYIRALVGLPSLADSREIIELMQADIEDGRAWRTCDDGPAWLNESFLLGVPYSNDADKDRIFAGLERLLMPAIVAGAVVAGSNVLGHVFYRLTEVPLPDTDILRDLPEPVDGLRRQYTTELETKLRDLYADAPAVENSLVMPLPVGGWKLST